MGAGEFLAMNARENLLDETRKRSPPAFSVVTALTCAVAKSRTSTQFPSGVEEAAVSPLIMAYSWWIDVLIDEIVGISWIVGYTVIAQQMIS